MSLGAGDEYETEHDSKPVCHGDAYFATAPWRASPILSRAPLCSKNNIRINSWPDYIQCSLDLMPQRTQNPARIITHNTRRALEHPPAQDDYSRFLQDQPAQEAAAAHERECVPPPPQPKRSSSPPRPAYRGLRDLPRGIRRHLRTHRKHRRLRRALPRGQRRLGLRARRARPLRDHLRRARA